MTIGQPELLTNPPKFLDDRSFHMRQAAFGEVPAHRAHHTARQLMLKITGIESLWPTDRKPLSLGESREVLGDSAQRLIIHLHAVTKGAQVCDHTLGRRVGRPVRGCARRTLQGTHPVTGRIHVGMLGEPNGAMSV